MSFLVDSYRFGEPPPDFGALVYPSAMPGSTTTPTAISFANEAYDVTGWHDTGSDTDRLTVIADVSIVRLTSNAEASDETTLHHLKASGGSPAVFRGMGKADTDGGTANAFVNICSAPIAVAEGDYFQSILTLASAAFLGVASEKSWAAIEILPAALKYALVYMGSSQAISAGTNTALTWDSEVADTDGFHESVTNPSRLSVPVGGPTLVRLVANVESGNTAGQFVLNINMNGATARGLPFKDCDTTGAENLNIVSAPIVVTPGTDYFEVIAFDTNATTIPANENCWFSIEEVPSDYKRALVHKTGGAQSFTGGAAYAAVTWDAEVYDTDSLHDNSSDNSRLTVPSGCTRARPIYNLKTSSVANNMISKVQKNGADYDGQPAFMTNTSGTDNLGAIGAWVEVNPGDYFEVMFKADTTCTIGTENESWFCLECE